jgi:hypothetical protein
MLYGKPERPAVCKNFEPSVQTCGTNREQALAYLRALEEATRPDS